MQAPFFLTHCGMDSYDAAMVGTAKNLIAIFFAKKKVEARAAKAARGARPVASVGVLGAGFMGAGYADRYGERLRPAALLRDMAARGARFYT